MKSNKFRLTLTFLDGEVIDAKLHEVKTRKLPKRDSFGRFVAKKRVWRGGEMTCPVCGTHFYF